MAAAAVYLNAAGAVVGGVKCLSVTCALDAAAEKALRQLDDEFGGHCFHAQEEPRDVVVSFGQNRYYCY